MPRRPRGDGRRSRSSSAGGCRMRNAPELVEVDSTRLEEVLRRVEQSLDEKDAALIRAVFESYAYVTDLVEDKNTSIRRLRQLFFGARTEKTEAVVGQKTETPEAAAPRDAAAETESAAGEGNTDESDAAAASKGHGRNGAEAYRGAERIDVPHPSLTRGRRVSRLRSRAPSTTRPRACWCGSPGSRRWRRRSTSCRSCAATCAARSSPRPRPKRPARAKYDATAGSMIGLLKYGSGLPFNRLEGLQGDLGVPLPASTQWDIVQAVAANLAPAFDELIRQAAQGEVLHNDDTTVKILELMGERGRQEALAGAADDASDADERTGPVHLGRGRPARRPPGRAVLQRPPARGREPGRGPHAPRRGAAAADPDVRCPVAQPAGRAADDPGALPGPCPAAVRRRLRSLSRAVPPPARSAGRGLSQRRRRAGASAVARGASAVPSGSERADDAGPARLADAATGGEADRAQFGPRRRDRLHAQALGAS